MKAIIYAGIGLFSAATVYGIADYYITKNEGTLDKLYKEEIPVSQTKDENNSTIELPNIEAYKEIPISTAKDTEKKIVTNKFKKNKKPVREIKLSDFSRGKISTPKVFEETKTVNVLKVENK
jgi:hypothetical protein